MNSSHTSTMLRDHDSARRDGVPARAAQLLARGPARMKSPSARWAVNVLAIAGAALMVWSGVIHLQLWSDGYRSISVIGPLFLIQGIGSIALAVAQPSSAAWSCWRPGRSTMAATAAGLLLSAGIGLFGYQESLAVPYAMSSLVVEFAGAAVLAAASALVLAARPDPGRYGASTPRQPVQASGTPLSRWPGPLPAIAAENFPVHPLRSNLFPAVTRMYCVRIVGTSTDELPDETLLAGLGAGDAELSLAFVRRFQGLVFGVAMTVIGDTVTAEDVAQQAFEQAWRHAQVFDARRGSVRAWLRTITHNLAVDVVRSRTSEPMDPDDLPAILTAVTDTPERVAEAHDNAAELRRTLARLPEPQARAVAMAGIYGMTAQQVADSEHVPLGTAKTRIRDGMQKLRAAYLPEEAGNE